jgi:hypothetical protein
VSSFVAGSWSWVLRTWGAVCVKLIVSRCIWLKMDVTEFYCPTSLRIPGCGGTSSRKCSMISDRSS